MADGPCSTFNGCQQLCLPGNGDHQRQCACAMGFQKGQDGTSCFTEPWNDHFLLFADTFQKEIYQMNMLTGQFKAIALSGHDNPISVDFDPEKGQIYWSDVASKVLKRALLNGSEEEVVKLMSANAIPDGIALDTISRLLYYTDAGNKIIAAMTLAEKYHVTIIKRHLNKPRAIALDPIRGYMYWTDWSKQSRIEKAAMDGTERKVLLETGYGGWPNGITVDIKGEKLYWCNARTQTIETANLDGENRKVIYRANRAHFFGITFSGDTLYYTDWTKKTIMKLEQVRSAYISTAIGQPVFARANDIHAYKSKSDKGVIDHNACSLRNGGCSHVCLPTPSGRKCACPDNFKHEAKSCPLISWDRKLETARRPLYPVSVTSAPFRYYIANTADDLDREEPTSVPVLVPTVVKDPTIGTTDRTRGNIKTEGEYTDTSSDKQSPKEISHGLSTGSTPSDVTRMATVKVNTEQPITEQQNVSRVSWSLSTPSTEYDADFPASRSAGSGDNSQHSVIDANDTDTEVEEEVSGTNSTIWLFGDRITYIGLAGILVGGFTVMIVIITGAIIIYKKSDPHKPKRQQRGDEQNRTVSRIGKYSATYSMPLQDAVTSSHTSAEHLTDNGDSYVSGDVMPGLENPSFSRTESNNTIYEEILGYSHPGPASPTFITFAKVTAAESRPGSDEQSSGRFGGAPPSISSSELAQNGAGIRLVSSAAEAQVARDQLSSSRDSQESSFTNRCHVRDSSGSSASIDAPPVADKGRLTGSEVTYAAVSRQKPETAVSRITAVIAKQFDQRR